MLYQIAYLFFFSLQTDENNERENVKRKRLKSFDSDHEMQQSSSAHRTNTKKLVKISNFEQKEDGELSDENDDSEEDNYRMRSRARSVSPVHQRKQIVYEIDDSYSSDDSSRNSPYNTFSGEQLKDIERR